MAKATFRIWRGNADGGELRDYTTEVSEGMVVVQLSEETLDSFGEAVGRYRSSLPYALDREGRFSAWTVGFRDRMNGKFQGVMMPTTPTGLYEIRSFLFLSR